MKRSETRILTTHAGSLPRPEQLINLNRARLAGETYDARGLAATLRQSVAEVVREQLAVGIQVPNDGEFGNATRAAVDYGAWATYVFERLTGFELPTPSEMSASGWRAGPGHFQFAVRRRDEVAFDRFYNGDQAPSVLSIPRPVCVAPVSYVGEEALHADLDNFKAALRDVHPEDAFVTSVAPGSIEVFARGQNRYYPSEAEFLAALGEAMRVEYHAIVDAGFVLQIDDPGLPDAWEMLTPQPTLDDYRAYAMQRVEALNAALRGIPEDRVRYHICWGSWHGPHTTDIPLRDVTDMLLAVKAGAYVVEAGNARHEHEWQVWQDVKLPAGKLLIPGVVSHATNVVEHPELVAERILRYAGVVGRENVMAGTDCGLGGRIHPQIAWAKLRALSDGAARASQQLWP
ncbi:MAG: cobalamin-independent methionine synthase II family protein [Chloroflexi bacterium]|nr:cobalamin-independent methionine synthase II family protein [Chloroflexota bacterium]